MREFEFPYRTKDEHLRSIMSAVVPEPDTGIIIIDEALSGARVIYANTEGAYLMDFFGTGADDWMIETDYFKGDIVINDGYYYQALEDHKSDDSAFSEDEDLWRLIGQEWIPVNLAEGMNLFAPVRLAQDDDTGAVDGTWDNSSNDIVLMK